MHNISLLKITRKLKNSLVNLIYINPNNPASLAIIPAKAPKKSNINTTRVLEEYQRVCVEIEQLFLQ